MRCSVPTISVTSSSTTGPTLDGDLENRREGGIDDRHKPEDGRLDVAEFNAAFGEVEHDLYKPEE